jgi:NAD+ kinase
MKNIGIVSNLKRFEKPEIAKDLIDFLISKGCEPFVEKKMGEKFGLERFAKGDKCVYSDTDMIIVLGGDGTILNAIMKNAKYETPFLGINFGHLGFLTDVDSSEIKKSVTDVLNGNYRIEKRMNLDAYIKGKNENSPFTALNEFNVSLGGIVDTAIFVNDEYIDNFFGDGMIVSTPTGSTAYNLAAGGPILKSDADVVAITPICPHMLHARSIVIGAQDVVKIKISSFTGDSVMLVGDGKNLLKLAVGDEAIIKKSKYYTNIIKTNTLGFYDVLRNKMFGKGGR